MKWWFSNGSIMHASTYVCENLAQTLLGLMRNECVWWLLNSGAWLRRIVLGWEQGLEIVLEMARPCRIVLEIVLCQIVLLINKAK